MNDPLEKLHNATNLRLRAGAKAGKYWLLRSEEREELIRRVIEDTMSSSIGVYNMPMGVSQSDPAMGGRNRFTKKQLRFAIQGLRQKKSSE
jgi:hypothetical protein